MGIDEHEKNIFGQVNKKDSRAAVSLGVMYTLPMLVNVQAEVYHDGIVRLSIMREDIPVSKDSERDLCSIQTKNTWLTYGTSSIRI